MARKIKRIGFDLDGVVVDKPPFIPGWFVEFIYRGYYDPKKELSYRYPTHQLEVLLRQISHHPIFRPPIKQQVEMIKKLHDSKKYKMFGVTSRYSFLKKRTKQWFAYHRMNGFFEKIYINENNEQPHLFKEKVIKKLGLDIFIDDDRPLLDYLQKKIEDVDFIFVEDSEDGLNRLLGS